MINIDSLRQKIKQNTDESLLQYVAQLPDHAPQLRAAMEYSLLAGGKRMRPLLVHLIGNTLDIPGQDQAAISMAIECIHAYSLAHDDLPAMDDDDLRRGKPTCHIQFDEATAILAGDALQTMAFSILAEAPMSKFAQDKRAILVSILARASGYMGMCGGQAIDLASTGKTIDIDALTRLHRLKTGALLQACAEMITLLAEELDPGHRNALVRHASDIGLAFQIQDDILDVEGDAAVIGKPQGSDIEAGKNTFPALLGMTQAKAELARLHDSALQALDSLPYNTELLSAFTDLMVKRTF